MNKTKTISVISLATLMFLAFTGSVSAQGDYLVEEDSLDQKYVWGDGLQDVSESFQVDVSRTQDYVIFTGAHSSVSEGSAPTLAIDRDDSGVADYQIQFKDGSWKISSVESNSWSEFSSLPSKYEADLDEDSFSVKVPVSDLSAGGKDYRFGMQLNLEEGQFLYPEGDGLWYNGEDYVHSDKYESLSIDIFESDRFEADTTTDDDVLDSDQVIDMVREFFDRPSNFIKDWVRDNFVHEQAFEDHKTQSELEIEKLQNDVDRLYNESDLDAEDRDSKTQTALQLMRENNMSTMSFTNSDGESVDCKLMEKPGTSRMQPVCIH